MFKRQENPLKMTRNKAKEVPLLLPGFLCKVLSGIEHLFSVGFDQIVGAFRAFFLCPLRLIDGFSVVLAVFGWQSPMPNELRLNRIFDIRKDTEPPLFSLCVCVCVCEAEKTLVHHSHSVVLPASNLIAK